MGRDEAAEEYLLPTRVRCNQIGGEERCKNSSPRGERGPLPSEGGGLAVVRKREKLFLGQMLSLPIFRKGAGETASIHPYTEKWRDFPFLVG